jgi:hypothetical protein
LTLFDDMPRVDQSPAKYAEDSFAFLNRARGPLWERIRAMLEEWFEAYPVDHAADLRGRFRERRPSHHWSAWWEMYLHHLFTRLGYELEVHPEIVGTTRKPDFLLTRAAERLYVEAAVVFSGVVDKRRDGERESWIMDAINRGTSTNFHVGVVAFERLGKNRPRDRDVYQPIERWLDGLDPDDVTAEYERTDEFPENSFVFGDAWQVRIRAYPVKPEARADPEPGRLLGTGPVTAGFVDDEQQLRDTLKHKRGAYGSLDAPFLVAVNCASSFMDDRDVAGALYGSIAYQYEIGVPDSGRPIRQRDGTWIDDSGPRGRRMSAVLTAVQLHPWTAARTVPQLWLNPWAERPLELDWPLNVWRSTDRGEVDVERRDVSMATLIGLAEDWPGPEPPFDD